MNTTTLTQTISGARADTLTPITDGELDDMCELSEAGHEDRRAELSDAEQEARADHQPGEALWIYWSRRWCSCVLVLTTVEGQSYCLAESGPRCSCGAALLVRATARGAERSCPDCDVSED